MPDVSDMLVDAGAKLHRAVSCIDVSGFPIGLRIEAGPCGLSSRIGLKVTLGPVPDIATKEPTHVFVVESFDLWWVGMVDEATLVDRVYRVVRQAVLHELDEHFLVSGRRVFDPHAQRSSS